MYTEFIIIYVLLVIIIALIVTNLIITIKAKKSDDSYKSNSKLFNNSTPVQKSVPSAVTNQNKNVVSDSVQSVQQNSGVVFCKKCAHQYPANEKFCPNCGTPRG